MKVSTDTEIIWERVKELNTMAHLYSEMADELTRVAQRLEGGEE